MNAKKCKAIRKAIRIESSLLPPGTLHPDGLVYRDTRKIIGWTFPQGWQKAKFVTLALVGGPWLDEAKKMMKPVFARVAINRPGSGRAIYLRAKQEAGML